MSVGQRPALTSLCVAAGPQSIIICSSPIFESERGTEAGWRGCRCARAEDVDCGGFCGHNACPPIRLIQNVLTNADSARLRELGSVVRESVTFQFSLICEWPHSKYESREEIPLDTSSIALSLKRGLCVISFSDSIITKPPGSNNATGYSLGIE